MCADNDKYVSRSRCQCVATMMNISLKVTLPMCGDNDEYKSQGHAANVCGDNDEYKSQGHAANV